MENDSTKARPWLAMRFEHARGRTVVRFGNGPRCAAVVIVSQVQVRYREPRQEIPSRSRKVGPADVLAELDGDSAAIREFDLIDLQACDGLVAAEEQDG